MRATLMAWKQVNAVLLLHEPPPPQLGRNLLRENDPMVVNSSATAHFHLAARNAPRRRFIFEIKLCPLGSHDIADSRAGEGNESVGQPHPGRDRSDLGTTKHVPQFR